MSLTRKQQAFIDHYFACGMNASLAARRAGYSNRANTAASQLMSNSVIREEIERIYRENTMPADEILARLSEQGRADIRDITNAEGLLDMRKARKLGKTGVIKRIKQTTITSDNSETHIIEVELHDPQKALQLLGKYRKLFIDRVQIEDWRSQAIEDIRAGKLDYNAMVDAFADESLVQELFRQAGVKVVVQDEA